MTLIVTNVREKAPAPKDKSRMIHTQEELDLKLSEIGKGKQVTLYFHPMLVSEMGGIEAVQTYCKAYGKRALLPEPEFSLEEIEEAQRLSNTS